LKAAHYFFGGPQPRAMKSRHVLDFWSVIV